MTLLQHLTCLYTLSSAACLTQLAVSDKAVGLLLQYLTGTYSIPCRRLSYTTGGQWHYYSISPAYILYPLPLVLHNYSGPWQGCWSIITVSHWWSITTVSHWWSITTVSHWLPYSIYSIPCRLSYTTGSQWQGCWSIMTVSPATYLTQLGVSDKTVGPLLQYRIGIYSITCRLSYTTGSQLLDCWSISVRMKYLFQMWIDIKLLSQLFICA